MNGQQNVVTVGAIEHSIPEGKTPREKSMTEAYAVQSDLVIDGVIYPGVWLTLYSFMYYDNIETVVLPILKEDLIKQWRKSEEVKAKNKKVLIFTTVVSVVFGGIGGYMLGSN
jgi:hypothetical protein